MIFKRFLFRRQQPADTPENQHQKAKAALAAGDRSERLEACRHLLDLVELRNLAEADAEAGVRELAQARYRKLLCGQEIQVPTLTARLAELSHLDDQRTLVQVAAHAKEPELRLAAIQRLTDQAALAACTLDDAATANRFAAAERLRERAPLELVARRIGKRDKNVLRLVRTRLKELAEEEARPARVQAQFQEICFRLEGLGRFESWSQDRGLLDLLDQQWAAIQDQAEPEWRNRHARERERFLTAYEAHCQTLTERIDTEKAEAATQATREGLIAELASAAMLAGEEPLRDLLRDISVRWDALGPSTSSASRKSEEAYQATLGAAKSRLETMASERQSSEQVRAWLAAAREALHQAKPIEHHRLAALLSQSPRQPGLDQDLATAFAEVRSQLEERHRHQLQMEEKRLDQARARLAELESALGGGELRHAESLFQSLQAALDAAMARGLPARQTATLKEGLQALAPRLRDLQQWRRWGADAHREGLCQAMEEVAMSSLPLAAQAQRLRDLQREWKGLDHSGSPVNHPLWDRFHAASEQVHTNCKPWLEQQATAREAARVAREALCAELEDFLNRVDWDRVDWKQALRAERETREGWARLGEVEGRHRRGLERRFHAALKRLDNRLTAERDTNQGHKRDLIAQVQALAIAPDLAMAIEETKRLQGEWHTTVPARQKDENRLWQEFRAACDAVFKRRRQHHEAQTAELVENLRAREAICSEAEALAQVGEALDAAGPFQAIEDRWRDALHLPVPRQAASGLEQRWRQALRSVETRRRELLTKGRQRTLDLLARQAQVCWELEQVMETGNFGSDSIAAAKTAWGALPHQTDPDLRFGMETRFRRACQALTPGLTSPLDLADERAATARKRAEICLRLEILAQIDSPPAYVHDRLAFQVNRLQEHMTTGERDPLAGASRLVELWYLTGPAPTTAMADLETRFERARAALSVTQADIPEP